jgi:hypothetical protein
LGHWRGEVNAAAFNAELVQEEKRGGNEDLMKLELHIPETLGHIRDALE